MIHHVAWATDKKGLRGAKLVEVLDHRAWGGTRATPDTYTVRYLYRHDDPNTYPHDKYVAMPWGLKPVGKYTLGKLNKLEEASHPDYRNEWVSFNLPIREHIPGTLD